MDGLSLDGFVAGVCKGNQCEFIAPFFLSYRNDVGNSGAKIQKLFENCGKMQKFKLQNVVKCMF